MSGPYYARSASDKREDWPLWMVCRDGLNVGWRDKFGPKLNTREACIAEAARLNAEVLRTTEQHSPEERA